MIRKKTLEQLLAESRARQAKIKEQVRIKKQQQREQDSKRRKEMQKHLAKIEQHENEKEERLKFNQQRAVDNRFWMDDDTDLYTSIDELKEAEKCGEGKINWELWTALIQKGNK